MLTSRSSCHSVLERYLIADSGTASVIITAQSGREFGWLRLAPAGMRETQLGLLYQQSPPRQRPSGRRLGYLYNIRRIGLLLLRAVHCAQRDARTPPPPLLRSKPARPSRS